MSPNFASDHAVDPHFDLEKDFQRVWVKGHLPADGLEYQYMRNGYYVGCAVVFEMLVRIRELDDDEAMRVLRSLGKQLETVGDELISRSQG